jgi:hypothetical protein
MRQAAVSLEPELSPSPKPALALVLFVAPVLYVLGTVLSSPWSALVPVVSLSLVLTLLAVIGWFLVVWKEQAGCWFTVLVLVLTVYLTYFLLHTHQSLALLCIPTLLAASMLGQRPLTVVAAGETLSLVALSRYLDPGAHPAAIFVAAAYKMVRKLRPLEEWEAEQMRDPEFVAALAELEPPIRRLGCASCGD